MHHLSTLAFLGNLGITEWILIIVLLMLLFGARKLPELAQSMGASFNAFKKGLKEGKEETLPDKGPDQQKLTGHNGQH